MKFVYTLNQELEQYKYWIIYGSGIMAVELYMTIIEKGGHIDFFCDMDDFFIGKRLLNKKIITVQEVAEFGRDACLIVCEEYGAEMLERLKELKIKNIFVPISEGR